MHEISGRSQEGKSWRSVRVLPKKSMLRQDRGRDLYFAAILV
jgi:hypothetical protein